MRIANMTPAEPIKTQMAAHIGFEDWNVQADAPNIRPGAIDLQSELHRRLYSSLGPEMLDTPRTFWRRKVLDKFESFMGHPLCGKILEIGAGTGWCSALLSRKDKVEGVWTLEYDSYCVRELMPVLFGRLGAREEKITRVLGSFNHMPQAKGRFDSVISIGALHHSENLPQTLRACFEALKPGGYLMATEGCESNSLTLADQHAKEEKIDAASQSKYGKVTRHKDNSDHYYRVCEFEAAAFQAGFDVWAFTFDKDGDRRWDDTLFRERKTYEGFHKIVAFPYFAQDLGNPLFDKLVLMLRKPE